MSEPRRRAVGSFKTLELIVNEQQGHDARGRTTKLKSRIARRQQDVRFGFHGKLIGKKRERRKEVKLNIPIPPSHSNPCACLDKFKVESINGPSLVLTSPRSVSKTREFLKRFRGGDTEESDHSLFQDTASNMDAIRRFLLEEHDYEVDRGIFGLTETEVRCPPNNDGVNREETGLAMQVGPYANLEPAKFFELPLPKQVEILRSATSMQMYSAQGKSYEAMRKREQEKKRKKSTAATKGIPPKAQQLGRVPGDVGEIRSVIEAEMDALSQIAIREDLLLSLQELQTNIAETLAEEDGLNQQKQLREDSNPSQRSHGRRRKKKHESNLDERLIKRRKRIEELQTELSTLLCEIRDASIRVVNAVEAWRNVILNEESKLGRKGFYEFTCEGGNYLLKMRRDLGFMDTISSNTDGEDTPETCDKDLKQFKALVSRWIGFPLKDNPFIIPPKDLDVETQMIEFNERMAKNERMVLNEMQLRHIRLGLKQGMSTKDIMSSLPAMSSEPSVPSLNFERLDAINGRQGISNSSREERHKPSTVVERKCISSARSYESSRLGGPWEGSPQVFENVLVGSTVFNGLESRDHFPKQPIVRLLEGQAFTQASECHEIVQNETKLIEEWNQSKAREHERSKSEYDPVRGICERGGVACILLQVNKKAEARLPELRRDLERRHLVGTMDDSTTHGMLGQPLGKPGRSVENVRNQIRFKLKSGRLHPNREQTVGIITQDPIPGKLIGSFFRFKHGIPIHKQPQEVDVEDALIEATKTRKREHRLQLARSEEMVENREQQGEMTKQNNEKEAATLIQALVRGHLGRKYVFQQKRTRPRDVLYYYGDNGEINFLEGMELREAAAITIQSHVRGLIERKNVELKEITAIEMQIRGDDNAIKQSSPVGGPSQHRQQTQMQGEEKKRAVKLAMQSRAAQSLPRNLRKYRASEQCRAGHRSKRYTNSKAYREDVATKLQAFVRGELVRCRYRRERARVFRSIEAEDSKFADAGIVELYDRAPVVHETNGEDESSSNHNHHREIDSNFNSSTPRIRQRSNRLKYNGTNHKQGALANDPSALWSSQDGSGQGKRNVMLPEIGSQNIQRWDRPRENNVSVVADKLPRI